MRILNILGPLLMCASMLLAQSPPAPLAVTGVTLVDVETGRLRADQTVLIQGKRIAAIGPRRNFRLPPATRAIDGTGKYLIPGLIDTHAHLFGPWARNWPDTIAQLGWITAGGVTTIRDAAAGGLESNYLALRAAADSGRLVAPRLRLSRVMRAGESFAEGSDHLLSGGLDGIKIRGQPREEALEIILAANRAGIPVYGHTDWAPTDTTRESYSLAAVQAGISGLMHLYGAFEEDGVVATNTGPPASYDSPPVEQAIADLHELSAWLDVDQAWQQSLIDAMVERGAWLEPTLTMHYHAHPALLGYCTREYDLLAVQRYYPYRSSAGRAPFTAAQGESARNICAAIKGFIRRFYEAGGMVVAGSDYVPFSPLGVTEEMRLLVEAGLSPLVALQAATINAARALELENEIGTIEPGKSADLVLLDGNPLEDIENVRSVVTVILNGRVLDREALLARTGTTPPMVARDDRIEVMDEEVRHVAFAHPDSIVDLVIETDGSISRPDVRRIEQLMRATDSVLDGTLLRVRGRALGARFVSRVRFVTRIRISPSDG